MAGAPTMPDQPLPLDDRRWRPIGEILEQFLVHTGSKALAALDLTEKLASGRVRCLRRNLMTGVREPVPASFWIDSRLDWSDRVFVERRPPPNLRGPWLVVRLRGWEFYVWQPDLIDTQTDEPSRRSGGKSSLLTDDQIDAGKKYVHSKLGDDPDWIDRVGGKKKAAMDVIANALPRLDVSSWQTVKIKILLPVFSERGVKQ
jgi:hypothetical protein